MELFFDHHSHYSITSREDLGTHLTCFPFRTPGMFPVSREETNLASLGKHPCLLPKVPFSSFFPENVGTDCFGSTAVNKFKFYQLFEIYTWFLTGKLKLNFLSLFSSRAWNFSVSTHNWDICQGSLSPPPLKKTKFLNTPQTGKIRIKALGTRILLVWPRGLSD